MEIVAVVVTALYVMLPAYIPNNAAVLAGGGPPIDFGRSWRGKRILGDGKTWRGTIFGILAGTMVAFLLNHFNMGVQQLTDVSVPFFTLGAMIGLPVGAMLGDSIASFIKRRTGRERGAPMPGLDQLDFVPVALGLTWLLSPQWSSTVFSLEILLFILIVTPVLHLGTNWIAYQAGLKEEPW